MREHALLLDGGVDQLVEVVHTRQRRRGRGDLPHLRGARQIRQVDDALRRVPLRPQPGSPDVVHLDVVRRRAAVLVHLHAAVDAVFPADGDGGIQLVHLEQLQTQPPVLHGEEEQHAAVDHPPPHTERDQLIERPALRDFARAQRAPASPARLDALIERFVFRLGLQNKAGADDVALHRAEDGFHYVAVALEVPRPGADDVPPCLIRGLAGAVRPLPARAARGSVLRRVGRARQQPPCLPAVREPRGKGKEHPVQEAHAFLHALTSCAAVPPP